MYFGHLVSSKKNILYEEYLKSLGKLEMILELGAGDGVNYYGRAKQLVYPGSAIIASQYANRVIAVERDPIKCVRLKHRLEDRDIRNVSIYCSSFKHPIWVKYAKQADLTNLDPCSLSEILDSNINDISRYVVEIARVSRHLCLTIPLPFRGKIRHLFDRVFNISYTSNISTMSLVEAISSKLNVSFKPQYRCKMFLRLLKEV